MSRQSFVFQKYECSKNHSFGKMVDVSFRYNPVKCLSCRKKAFAVSSPQEFKETTSYSNKNYPYFDKIQNRAFVSKTDFESFCRSKNFYKPTQKEIKAHREYYADMGSRK